MSNEAPDPVDFSVSRAVRARTAHLSEPAVDVEWQLCSGDVPRQTVRKDCDIEARVKGCAMSATEQPVKLPPRWFIRAAWSVHRMLYRCTGGRVGLWRPKPGKWGTLRLTTTGRRTGVARSVMVGYFQDGHNFVTMAMNGWGEAEPAWWLNLQANPEATIDLKSGTRTVIGRLAHGEERERLWAIWKQIDKNLDAYAALRPRETAVVVLEPSPSDSRNQYTPDSESQHA